jgi:diguanylate cyclase (GGDEF)-like protein
VTDADHPLALDWRARRRMVAPFAALVAATSLLALIPPHAHDTRALYITAAGAFGAALALIVFAPWGRLHPAWTNVPVVLFCVAVALLRQIGGGPASGYAPLFMLPVVWQALYGRRVDMGAAVGVVFLAYALPIVLVDGVTYPASQWRAAILFTAVVGGIGILLSDLTQARRILVAQLEEAATTDRLTGLANRRRLDDNLSREVARARRSGAPLSVAVLDLDHFKDFNDTRGHLAGDEVLRELSDRWLTELRDGDELARWGGEEFVVLLPDTTVPEAAEVIERLLAGGSGPGGPPPITASAGVAGYVAGTTAEELLAEADRLLYRAKRDGRNRVATAAGSVLVGQGRARSGGPA